MFPPLSILYISNFLRKRHFFILNRERFPQFPRLNRSWRERRRDCSSLLTYTDWLLMQKKTGSYRFNFSKTLPLFSLREFFFLSLCFSFSLSLFLSPTSRLKQFLDSQVSRHSLSSFFMRDPWSIGSFDSDISHLTLRSFLCPFLLPLLPVSFPITRPCFPLFTFS